MPAAPHKDRQNEQWLEKNTERDLWRPPPESTMKALEVLADADRIGEMLQPGTIKERADLTKNMGPVCCSLLRRNLATRNEYGYYSITDKGREVLK